ncbi:MAG: dihydrolipoyl dehydrogenase, partial [Sphingomonadales bacterium]
MADEFDLIVIGGGPGGYVAAIRAAQLGMKVALAEREHLGGICLNWGCIPTKALLRTSEINHLMHNLGDYGLSATNQSFNIKAVVKRSRGIAKQLNTGIGHLLKKNNVTVYDGEASLKRSSTILIRKKNGNSKKITGTNIIIATGARARELPHLKADGKQIWTYKDAMTPEEMPKSLLVIGSGAIGIEFASFYNDMGADVTVIELMDRILPIEDKDISEHALKSFKKQGLKFITSASVSSLKKDNSGVTCTIVSKDGSKKIQKVDKVILAIGITGNIEGLNLEEVGVKVDKGHIQTNKWGETDVKGIWAIGDITGPPWLAHKASHEGVIAVEKIAGHEGVHPLNKENIPGCTYCRPQIASVGMTEEDALTKGHEVKIGRFPFVGNGKAIALG